MLIFAILPIQIIDFLNKFCCKSWGGGLKMAVFALRNTRSIPNFSSTSLMIRHARISVFQGFSGTGITIQKSEKNSHSQACLLVIYLILKRIIHIMQLLSHVLYSSFTAC